MKKGQLKLDGKVIFPVCLIANDFISRLVGLMGQKKLEDSFALFFPVCNSIHTFFMKMPIDVIFLNSQYEIVAIYHSLPPWRLILPKRNYKHVLEFRAGKAKSIGLSIYEKLQLEEVHHEI